MGENTNIEYQNRQILEREIRQNRKARYSKQAKRIALYYAKQRRMGFILLIIGILSVGIGCFTSWNSMQTVGFIVGLFGLYCIITKRMIYLDSFYFECQDKIRNLI